MGLHGTMEKMEKLMQSEGFSGVMHFGEVLFPLSRFLQWVWRGRNKYQYYFENDGNFKVAEANSGIY